MKYRGGPLRRLVALFVTAVTMTACGGGGIPPALPTAPAPSPMPGPESPPEALPRTEPDPADRLPAEVAATRRALLVAARSGDLESLGPLLPADPADFSSNFAGEPDHLAFYRSLETDVLAELIPLLEGSFVIISDTTIWPELHARVPFIIQASERLALEERYGAERLAQWEAAGAYLGWRIGIDESGAWLFFIAGD
jgi:hypothetical protein